MLLSCKLFDDEQIMQLINSIPKGDGTSFAQVNVADYGARAEGDLYTRNGKLMTLDECYAIDHPD